MSNVRFTYLYRDGSNYKKWCDVVFSNLDEASLETVSGRLRECFLPDGLFIAHQIRVPEVFLANEDRLTADDHCFHEFHSVEGTSDRESDYCRRSIRQFLEEVIRESNRGWVAFDPSERLLRAGE